MHTLQKKILSLILLLSMSASVLANTPLNNIRLNKPESKAIEFAKQAGAIAGVAQACGQNLGDFPARITEAINKLAVGPSDKVAAALVYQRISQEIQMAEKRTQTIPCTKVLQDFRNLPIMQPNYKTTVIDQLNSAGP